MSVPGLFLSLRIGVLTAAVAAASTAAWADIVEVRGKGMLNGKILFEDEQGMRFKDASGHEHLFAKKDVLFTEKEKEPTLGEKLKRAAGSVLPEKRKKPAPVAPKPAVSAGTSSSAAGGTGGLVTMAFEQMAQAQAMAGIQQAKMNRAITEAEGGGGGGGGGTGGDAGGDYSSDGGTYYRKSVLDEGGGFVSLKD